MAIGEIGLSLKDFYRLTYHEFHLVAKGYMLKDERGWMKIRWLGTLMVNIQLPKDKNITPDMLISLPSDSLIIKKKPVPTKDEFLAAVERYNPKGKDKV